MENIEINKLINIKKEYEKDNFNPIAFYRNFMW